MALALYAPGLGYYANTSAKFGHMPSSGSDFVTAPELTPMFGATLAAQVAEALEKTGTDTVWEFGAGSGALAVQLLHALDEIGRTDVRYRIVDLSGTCASASSRRWCAMRTASNGSANCPRRCKAWSSATRCSMRCRCSCWRA
jgi:SAM-dependent MidA family methyltransferase